ncbi:hypothetical protein AVEN_2933-1, partial [Araneus ventricosus]
ILCCRGVQAENSRLQDEKIKYSRPYTIKNLLRILDWCTPNLKLCELPKIVLLILLLQIMFHEGVQRLYFNNSDELSFLQVYFIKKK